MSAAPAAEPAAVQEQPVGPGSDAHAFDLEAVVAAYETPLLRYVGQILGRQAQEVEEVVQDAFLRLQRQVGEHGAASVQNLPSWLFRVAHNLAMDAGRRRQRQGKLEEQVMQDPALAPASPSAAADLPAEELARREASALAVTELHRLPSEQQHVLLLKVIQGLTLREISDITGLKIGTVNYRLTQGLRELSRRLKEAGAI